MKRIATPASSTACLALLLAFSAAAQTDRPLTNKGVAGMADSGLSPS